MIECVKLSKFYRPGTAREVRAVNEVSFTVREGEVFGLLGANGAGKTSALRTVATILEPTAGDCRVDGVDIREHAEDARRRMGYLSGETRLYERLTPVELIDYFGEFFEVPADQVKRRREMLTEKLGMGDYVNTPCGELSTGRKQDYSDTVWRRCPRKDS